MLYACFNSLHESVFSKSSFVHISCSHYGPLANKQTSQFSWNREKEWTSSQLSAFCLGLLFRLFEMYVLPPPNYSNADKYLAICIWSEINSRDLKRWIGTIKNFYLLCWISERTCVRKKRNNELILWQRHTQLLLAL